jgi:hypothetical protein
MTTETKKSFLNQNAISIMAAIVSACALAVSFYQTSIMREQQYASVRPLVMMGNSMMTNDEDSTGYSKILIWNRGIGPALIKYVDMEYKGQHYSEFEFQKIANRMLNRPDSLVISCMTSNATAAAVSANEEITMFEINDKKLCYKFNQVYFQAKNKGEFSATVYYTDVYDRYFKISMDGQKVLPSSKKEILSVVPEKIKPFVEF